MWYNYHMRKELKLGVLFAVVAARGMAALPPGLDELWGGEDMAWSLVRQ